ncbi:MAG: DUF4282 domain-containing protein [Agriterribacter sp.]
METNITPTIQKLNGFEWKDFLSFKTMITLKIIQIMYVVIAVIITIGGLATMFSGGRSGGYGPASFIPGGFMGGLLIIIFGNVLWRVWCELIIVFFRINKSLNNIDDKTKS